MKNSEEETMNKKRFYICAAIIFSVSTFSTAFAASFCNQTFTFLGKTYRTFWLTEELGGDCEHSLLIQLAVNDPNVTLIKTNFKNYVDCSKFKETMAYFDVETPVELTNKNDIWKPDKGSWFIKAPDHNDGLMKKFGDHVHEGGSDGRSWHDKYKQKGFLPPQAHNTKTKILYYYRPGLYINYTISKAYYYPRSGHILIFTNQKALAVGMDTMHGFILMEIIKGK
jgi:hypothetical protein